MVLASIPKLVLGSIAFVVFWILAVFPAVPFLPIGRSAGSLLSAVLMVLFRVITPVQAYAAIDLPILGLLFGTMVVSDYLKKVDMFKYLGKLLSWGCTGAKDLLLRICLISALSSALFTNDTSCVVLTEFVLKIARQHNLPPHPFLLALASSANIGSSATPIGNPQNLVITIQSKISFGEFLIGILPATLVGVMVNALILLSMYWKQLSIHMDASEHQIQMTSITTSGSTRNSDALGGMMIERPSQIGVETSTSRDENMHSLEEQEKKNAKWKKMLRKSSVYMITLGMLVALLLGLNMSWTVIATALALVVLDFKDAKPSLEKVSYPLLIFFCGMFIAIDGFNKTGIPSTLWDLMEPYSKPNHASGIAILGIVILVLSNVASNVPTVLLLGGRVAASAAAISEAQQKKAWLILAWVSTVAGNLSLLGSAANLIVCEQAYQDPIQAYTLTFFDHLKFGLPSTFIVTTIGLTLIRRRRL